MTLAATEPTVSVIVVSRGRPDALRRCLLGIEQLFYCTFEVIVVADPAGAACVRDWDRHGSIKLVEFDEANISAARNLGLERAGGKIVAFIDDDSVPEPSWLGHLIAPFADGGVAAAGGYVIGRNGISFQSTAQTVDFCGWDSPLAVNGDAPVVVQGTAGRAVKTEGTNCAFRTDILARIGGFDPAYRFYMDETDVNLRLGAEGLNTAIVPLAQVHHGFAASAQRHRSRMPRTLFDVGASHMILLRKHAPPDQVAPTLARLRAEQHARLIRNMVAGHCEPGDVTRVLRTLEAGIAEGAARPLATLPPMGNPREAFQRFEGAAKFAGSIHVAGRERARAKLRQQAAEKVAEGQRVSLFLFSPTALFHRVSFRPDGYWEQRGGLFGKSQRTDPVWRASAFRTRLAREKKRVEAVRCFTN